MPSAIAVVSGYRRAYALIDHVKQVTATGTGVRTIAGIATSPEVDRVGDEIVMDGVTFANPIPLLLFHDTQRPIGLATLGAATTRGVPFTAELPDPDTIDSEIVRERIKEASASLDARLIKGVSIGFRPIDGEIEIMKDGGLRFLKIEILELSLVVVPANADATVQTIKEFSTRDTSAPAAAGDAARVVTLSPTSAAAGIARTGAPMTYQERIKSFENERAAKMAAIEDIQKKVGDENRTKDVAEREKTDGLKADVLSIDAELKDLRELEELNKKAAVPVAGQTGIEGAQSRGATQVIRVTDRLEKGIAFARYAMCLMSAKGNTTQAYEIAKHRYPDMSGLHTVLKAAVNAGTTTDPTWAGALVDYANFAGDFIDFLRPQTIIGRIPGLTRVPFNVRVLGQTSGGAAYWVGEGAPKPLTKFDFAARELGSAKVAAIAVISDELARQSSPSAEMLVRNALSAAVIERMDIDFIDPTKAAVAGVSPASITNGVSATTHTGTNAAAVRTAVTALVGTFLGNNNNIANGVWIMPNTVALQLSLMMNSLGQAEFPTITMNGGTFLGMPVVTTQYAARGGSPGTGDLVILANASDIFLADDGQVVIDASREASLQMLDNPTNSSGAGSPLAPVPTTVVSMFQTNSVALRAERFINWARRRDEAVAWLDDVGWVA